MKNYLKVDLKRTEKQVALIKQLGSRNRTESLAAAEAIAQIVQDPLLQVIEQAPVISNLFESISYARGTPPSLPLATFFDVKQRNYLQTWTQTQPGGNGTNFVQGASELFAQVYDLWSAASLNKNYAEAANLRVVAATLERLAQEILLKRNNNAAGILMNSLATSVIDGNPANTASSNYQVYRTATAGVFQLDDFNTIMTKYRRIVSSWVGGTPVGVRASISDLLGSPEWMAQIRAIAYQPSNTRVPTAGAGTATYLAGGAIPAPESIRESIFKAAGNPELFGITLQEYNEFGQYVAATNQGVYNQLFSTYAGSTAYVGFGGSGTATFAPTTEQIVIGLNTAMFDLVRLTEAGDAGTYEVMADDSFTLRSGKVGWLSHIKEGYLSVDNRAKLAISW
jgi:hypothetical protein